MERLRSMMFAAAAFALTPGCIHVHTDADGKLKSVELKGAAGGGKAADPAADPEVKPAAATVPAGAVSAVPAALSKLAPKLGPAAGPPAVEFAVTWRNKLEQLPDPTRAGAMGTGILGQMFLFGAGPKMPFAPAEGKLVVELFDESPRPGMTEPVRLGSWTYEKDHLKRMVTTDERFGKCYALFLPWPTYRPDITRVRLTARYEPEGGHVLYAPPTTMTIDTTTGGEGSPVVRSTQYSSGPVVMPANPAPPGAAPGGFPTAFPMAPAGPGGFPMTPSGPGAFPMAPPSGPAPIPLFPPTPAGPAGPTAGSGVPTGLPPIAFTLPAR